MKIIRSLVDAIEVAVAATVTQIPPQAFHSASGRGPNDLIAGATWRSRMPTLGSMGATPSARDWLKTMLTVALFSRHDDLLRLLSALLSRQAGVAVVSATGDPLELVEEVGRHHPAVAVLDDFHVSELSLLCADVLAASATTALALLRSPLGIASEELPPGLQRLELQKPIRVPDLVRSLEDFVGETRQRGSQPIAC